MVKKSYKNGFMLVTVLMVLLLLSIVSVGILFLSSSGMQRTATHQDSSIAYINAMSGVNMVSSFLSTINRAPAWPHGEEFQNLPSQLQTAFPITTTGTDGSEALIGEFEVLSFNRLPNSQGPNIVPQDFEIIVAGRSLGSDGTMSNEVQIRMRTRIQADAFTRWVYFLNTHPNDIWWVGSHPTLGRGTRLHGPVHFNEGTNIHRRGNWYLDPQDPMFVSWDYGRTPNLSIVTDNNPNSNKPPFTWNGGAIPAWNESDEYRLYEWGSTGNPNSRWFGVAGWTNTEHEVTYGGHRQIDTNADYIPFPTRAETQAIRNMIFNGDPEQSPGNIFQGGHQPPPDHNPESVQIPDSDRPDGGIFINGDVSMHFQTHPLLDGSGNHIKDSNNNNVYNNRIIIEQPSYTSGVHGRNLVFRWVIDIERDQYGQPVRMTRRFYRRSYDTDNNLEIPSDFTGDPEDYHGEPRPVFRNSPDMEEVYNGPFNDEGLGIYVDGNIGWVDRGHDDKQWLQRLNDGLTIAHNVGVAQDYLINRRIQGLSGETYGRITIYATLDIAITDDFTFAEYQIPLSPDFTHDDFARTNYINGIVARNVAIVPHFYCPSDPGAFIRNFETPFYVDSGIIATGLNPTSGHRVHHGSMGNIMWFHRFGKATGNNSNVSVTAYNGPVRVDGDNTKGRFLLRGSYAANTRTAFGYTTGSGMRHSWYYDLRFRVTTPFAFPQAGLRTGIFDLSRIN